MFIFLDKEKKFLVLYFKADYLGTLSWDYLKKNSFSLIYN